jgi:hypothetical protein
MAKFNCRSPRRCRDLRHLQRKNFEKFSLHVDADLKAAAPALR